jgi:hypothetical protein
MHASSNGPDRKVILAASLAALLAAGGVAYATEFRGSEGAIHRPGAGMADRIDAAHREGRGNRHMGGNEGGMGGGMMGMPMMGGRLCQSNDSMVPRMTQRLERSVTLTDAQKPDFEALKAAMAKAEATMKAACPTDAERNDRTPTGRLAVAEKRMTAGLEAIRTVRPAFDTFYGKLDDRQRDQLRWAGRGDMGGDRGGRHGDRHHQSR